MNALGSQREREELIAHSEHSSFAYIPVVFGVKHHPTPSHLSPPIRQLVEKPADLTRAGR